jgi:transposase-like protein
MKMMHTMSSEALAPMPKRRLYSPELKRQVVAETHVRGASVAGVALSHGINDNIVHRWLRERAGQLPVAQSGFVALCMPRRTSSKGLYAAERVPVGLNSKQCENVSASQLSVQFSPLMSWMTSVQGQDRSVGTTRPTPLPERVGAKAITCSGPS